MFTRIFAGSAIDRATVRSKGATLAKLAALVAIAFGLASCVISDHPLIVDPKPFLGERFDAVVFRDFAAGSGYASQKVDYRWTDGFYVRASEPGKHFVKFTAEPLSSTDFLVERSQDDRTSGQTRLFTYFIARRVADGAYLLAPVAETDLPPEDRDRMCEKDQPEDFCAVKDHDELLLFARATAAKDLRDPSVAVLSPGVEPKAESSQVGGAQK